MKELERIKKVEGEVVRSIEKAKKAAEKKVADLLATRDKRILEAEEKANGEMDKKINEARGKAEKEAERIKSGISKELDAVTKQTEKNFNKAVKFIVDEFSKVG